MSQSVEKIFVIRTLFNLLNFNNIERCSIKTSLGAVFAERFIKTFRDLLKKAIFEKGVLIGL